MQETSEKCGLQTVTWVGNREYFPMLRISSKRGHDMKITAAVIPRMDRGTTARAFHCWVNMVPEILSQCDGILHRSAICFVRLWWPSTRSAPVPVPFYIFGHLLVRYLGLPSNKTTAKQPRRRIKVSIDNFVLGIP